MEISEKSKQRLKIIGVAVAAFGVIAAISLATSGSGRRGILGEKKEEEKITILKGDDLEREKWRSIAEKDIEKLEKYHKELTEKLESLEKKLSAQAKDTEEGLLPPPPELKETLSSSKSIFSPPPLPSPLPTFDGKGPLETVPRKIQVFTPEPVSHSSRRQSRTGPQTEEEPNVAKGNWIPSGSFVSGILLSGLDAPTGVQAQSSPHPVLVRLAKPANLPNLRRLDVKECFVTGGGYGDLASERAYIRLETLSCVLHSGRVIDTQVKGFISGEDGKVGLRGRLVSKQGRIIGRAILAGFAGGIGKAFSAFGGATSIGGGGVVSVGPDDLKDIAIAGAGGGISESMDIIADYYLRLAEATFPVIEIDAGRTVDVVILEGKELKPRETLASKNKETSGEKLNPGEEVLWDEK